MYISTQSRITLVEFLDFNPNWNNFGLVCAESKENRIYIRVEFTRKKCKTAILLYYFHTAGVLHIFVLYRLLGPGPSFYKNLKLILKENQIMK